ncbi:MAG: hypothetical protein E6K71_06215 [Candidatus Eisenbacteria bacterium]|uniref:Cytochrome c-552/4 domain-containing protein n=1 Tax=Eiseniibacteriota bacterium TaxID=2212470 RepID=A0A538SC26_UNCEI|nr:MAG: hypothetical protein E6K71_06215 [Candidatus Eisenbacteria bacterium]
MIAGGPPVPRPGTRGTLVLAAAVAALACWGSEARAQDLRPARFCGACHGPIRREWETSAMAKSAKNPVFLAFLEDARAARGDTVVAFCVACHAPAAAVTADYKLEADVSKEGVTCNFCHNVSAVDPSPRPASYTFDGTDPLLMRGPYKDADPGSAHRFAYSGIPTPDRPRRGSRRCIGRRCTPTPSPDPETGRCWIRWRPSAPRWRAAA